MIKLALGCELQGCKMRIFSKLKVTLVAVSLVTLSACGTIVKNSNASLSGAIADDAIKLNDAFNKATNAVLLKNILRARDRWPTNYTTLSGIKSTPTISQSNGLTLSPLGLGNPEGPGQGSGTVLSQGINSSNEYDVNPFAAADRSESLLTPVTEKLFERYYNSWPRDVVTLMFIKNFKVKIDNQNDFGFHNSGDEFQRVEGDLKAALFLSDAELLKYYSEEDKLTKKSMVRNFELNLKRDLILTDSTSLGASNNARACTSKIISPTDITAKDSFIAGLTQFQAITDADISLTKLSERQQTTHNATFGLDKDNMGLSLKICESKESANKILKLTPGAYEKAQQGGKIIPHREITITLRSFEDIVYYLGETLRVAGTDDQPTVYASCDKIVTSVPIFKTSTQNEYDYFAISVKHAGDTVKALPKGTDSNGKEMCLKERSATVMSILNQLLLLNQSPEFLKAPENFFR